MTDNIEDGGQLRHKLSDARLWHPLDPQAFESSNESHKLCHYISKGYIPQYYLDELSTKDSASLKKLFLSCSNWLFERCDLSLVPRPPAPDYRKLILRTNIHNITFKRAKQYEDIKYEFKITNEGTNAFDWRILNSSEVGGDFFFSCFPNYGTLAPGKSITVYTTSVLLRKSYLKRLLLIEAGIVLENGDILYRSLTPFLINIQRRLRIPDFESNNHESGIYTDSDIIRPSQTEFESLNEIEPTKDRLEQPRLHQNALQSNNNTMQNQFWKLNTCEFSNKRLLANGGSGASIMVVDLHHVPVALKKWDLGDRDYPPLEFKSELEVLNRLKHPNLIPLIGACSTRGKAFFVMPYFKNGSLSDFLQKQDSKSFTESDILDTQHENVHVTQTSNLSGNHHLPSQQSHHFFQHQFKVEKSFTLKLKIAIGIASALEYLHSQEFAHLDVKSLNVLLSDEYEAILIDFGTTREKNAIKTSNKGSQDWMAPEVCSTNEYSFKSDIFSFGLVLWELISERFPNRSVNDLATGKVPPLPEQFVNSHPTYAHLYHSCCQFDPSNRPSMRWVLANLRIIFDKQPRNEDEYQLIWQHVHNQSIYKIDELDLAHIYQSELDLSLDISLSESSTKYMFAGLTSLDLRSNENISDFSIATLPRGLTYLNIASTRKITNRSIASLPRPLKTLIMDSSTRLTSACASDLPSSITTFSCYHNSNFDDEFIKKIPSSITSLIIASSVLVTDDCVGHLPKRLCILNLDFNEKLTSACLEKMPESLEELHLSSNPNISLSTTYRLPSGLKLLKLRSGHQWNDHSISLLPETITHLTLNTIDFIPDGLTSSCAADFPPNLRILELPSNRTFTNQAIFNLPRELTVLNLKMNEKLNDECVAGFPKGLKVLNLENCKQISELGALNLPPKIEELNLSNNMHQFPETLMRIYPSLRDLKLGTTFDDHSPANYQKRVSHLTSSSGSNSPRMDLFASDIPPKEFSGTASHSTSGYIHLLRSAGLMLKFRQANFPFFDQLKPNAFKLSFPLIGDPLICEKVFEIVKISTGSWLQDEQKHIKTSIVNLIVNFMSCLVETILFLNPPLPYKSRILFKNFQLASLEKRVSGWNFELSEACKEVWEDKMFQRLLKLGFSWVPQEYRHFVSYLMSWSKILDVPPQFECDYQVTHQDSVMLSLTLSHSRKMNAWASGTVAPMIYSLVPTQNIYKSDTDPATMTIIDIPTMSRPTINKISKANRDVETQLGQMLCMGLDEPTLHNTIIIPSIRNSKDRERAMQVTNYNLSFNEILSQELSDSSQNASTVTYEKPSWKSLIGPSLLIISVCLSLKDFDKKVLIREGDDLDRLETFGESPKSISKQQNSGKKYYYEIHRIIDNFKSITSEYSDKGFAFILVLDDSVAFHNKLERNFDKFKQVFSDYQDPCGDDMASLNQTQKAIEFIKTKLTKIFDKHTKQSRATSRIYKVVTKELYISEPLDRGDITWMCGAPSLDWKEIVSTFLRATEMSIKSKALKEMLF